MNLSAPARLVVALIFVTFSSVLQATPIVTVLVDDANNPPDTTGFGAVDNPYRIGATEVTNAQHVVFLNAVAADDTHELYNSTMTSLLRGGIVRSGVSGNYVYAAKDNMANKPVNLVSFWDAAFGTLRGLPTGFTTVSRPVIKIPPPQRTVHIRSHLRIRRIFQ